MNGNIENTKNDDAKKRLDYLLQQAGLFSHFVTQGSPVKSNRGRKPKNKDQPNRRSHMEDDDEDESTIQTTNFRFDESPPYINGEMRDYQVRGLNWMISLYDNHINGILADEMGLGKTIQTISMIGFLKNYKEINGPHLIIAPKSTLRNWINEFNRFCPSIRPVLLIGDAEARKEIIKKEMADGKWDACVTSYEMCLLEKNVFKKIKWHYVVVDEAHRLKNEKSKLSIALREISSKNRLLLTGTPLQNNLHELWSLLNFLLPDVFNSSDDFDAWFDSNKCLDDDDGVVKRLHAILKPFMLRRIKSDVEKSLLPKKEVKIFVGLSKMQRKWYTNLLLKNIEVVNNFGESSKMRLDNVMMALRKCSNHPYLFEGAEPGPPYTTDEHIVHNSGKMIVLDKLLSKLKSQGSRVLLFTQFRTLLDILEDYLIWRGYQYCRLDGQTDLEARAKGMEEFNAPNSSKFIYMLTTRAGGLGINLVTADVVIIYDSDWNPQPDLQAMDRAHRIGQKKQVRVFRLITENTIDERLIERAEVKLRLDKLVIQQGRLSDSKMNQLSKDERIQMIQHGAKYVLASTESDIKDEDIDEIMERGEAKTAEQNKALADLGEGQLRTFTLDTKYSVFDFEGVDFREQRKEQKRTVPEALIALPPRERRRVFYVDPRPAPKQRPQPRIKQPVLHDYQFFSPHLQELFTLECSGPLNEQDEALKQKFVSEGFGNWTRTDLKAFTDALIKYGRNDLDNICQSVPGKEPDEVLRYNKSFWSRGHILKNYKHIVASVERTEQYAIQRAQFAEALEWKLGQYLTPMHQLLVKYTKSEEFTRESDRYLVCSLHKFGLKANDVYDLIKNDIQNHFMTRYDFYMRSRSTLEIKRRCELLLKAIVKEYEENRKENNGTNSNNDNSNSNAIKPQKVKKRRSTMGDPSVSNSKRPKTTKT